MTIACHNDALPEGDATPELTHQATPTGGP